MKESNTTIEESRSLTIIKEVSDVNKSVQRDKLARLELAMLQEEQVEIKPTHRFSGGIYSREITIPKGTLLTGRIHKFDHFDIMLSGDITVSTDSGEVKRLKGLNIMEGKAGKKRAGYAHEDTHWITFHSAEDRDPEEMYEYLTCGSFEELEQFNLELDRADYRQMIESMGMTESQVQEQVTIDDVIELESVSVAVKVGSSEIDGKGLFANHNYYQGEEICFARWKESRTIAGRYSNHSYYPNAEMVVSGKSVILRAKTSINAGDEITVDYRQVIHERDKAGDL